MTSDAKRRAARALRFAVGVLVLAGIFVPVVAEACPVCRDPREDNQAAFLSMTIFMSLLPLGLIGGLIGFLWKSSRDEVPEEPSATGLTPREDGQS